VNGEGGGGEGGKKRDEHNGANGGRGEGKKKNVLLCVGQPQTLGGK